MPNLNANNSQKKADNTQLRKKLAKLFEKEPNNKQATEKNTKEHGRKNEVEEASGTTSINTNKLNGNMTKVTKNSVGLAKGALQKQKKTEENVNSSKQTAKKVVSSTGNKKTLNQGLEKEENTNALKNQKKKQEKVSPTRNKKPLNHSLEKETNTNALKTQKKKQEKVSPTGHKKTINHSLEKETNTNALKNQKKKPDDNKNAQKKESPKAKGPKNKATTSTSPLDSKKPNKQTYTKNKNNSKQAKIEATTVAGTAPTKPKETKPEKNKPQVNGDSGSWTLKRSAAIEKHHEPKEKKKKTFVDVLEEPYDSYDDTDFEMSESEYENSESSASDSFMLDSDEFFEDEEEDDYSYQSNNGFDYDEEEEMEEEEEETDAYSYSDGSSYICDSDDDQEYKLPHSKVEDVIIRKGTAQMRPLKKEDNVQFDSESEEPQIQELTIKQAIISVQQPEEYLIEALNEINDKHAETIGRSVLKLKEPTNEINDCPKLVPIVDSEGFQVYHPDLDMEIEADSEDYDDDDDEEEGSYEEFSDDDFSEDINSKYTNDDESSDWDSECELEMNAEVLEVKSKDLNKKLPIIEEQQKVKEFKKSNDDELPSTSWMNLSALDESKTVVFETSLSDSEHQQELEGEELDSEVELVEEEHETELILNFFNDEDDALPTAIPQRPVQIEKPFRTFFCNAADANYVLAFLKEPFCIYGTVVLEVLVGSVEVYGYVADPGDELEIFSPRGCSSVQVTSKPNAATNKSELKTNLQKLETYFARKDLEYIGDNFVVRTDALVLLKRNDQRKKIVNTLKKHMNENVFPNIHALSLERPYYASEYLLGCLVSEDDGQQLIVPPEWYKIRMVATSKIILAGGKSVGKSTLVRYLINRHVKQHHRVLLIDLDIGQPELFVPQTVSCYVATDPLLGPGWFLNRQPRKSLLVGNINPVLAPHTYLKAIRGLIEYCRADEELSAMPWVVNTMGYNKGFGLELMALIRQMVQPTDIVQLVSNKEINNFDILLDKGLSEVPSAIFEKPLQCVVHSYRLHVLQSAVRQESRYQKEWRMSAKDMRYAMVLARLSDALQGNAEFLNDCTPLCATLAELKLVSMASCDVSQIDLAKSMKTSLVYLCHRNGKKEEENGQPMECLGLGVTRGFDTIYENIYLQPAMPLPLLSTVNCLAISEIPLPTTIFMRQSLKIADKAPYLYNTVVGKSTKSVKQIYHRPEEFLRGNHRNLVG